MNLDVYLTPDFTGSKSQSDSAFMKTVPEPLSHYHSVCVCDNSVRCYISEAILFTAPHNHFHPIIPQCVLKHTYCMSPNQQSSALLISRFTTNPQCSPSVNKENFTKAPKKTSHQTSPLNTLPAQNLESLGLRLDVKLSSTQHQTMEQTHPRGYYRGKMMVNKRFIIELLKVSSLLCCSPWNSFFVLTNIMMIIQQTKSVQRESDGSELLSMQSETPIFKS